MVGTDGLLGSFDVAVAVVPADGGLEAAGGHDNVDSGALPGYDEAIARPGLLIRRSTDRVLVKGEEAVRAATEMIAGQIGLAAQRIAVALDTQEVEAAVPGKLGVESVDVSFGITLSAGVQALFTARADSSVQVCITLARRPAAAD